MKIGGEWGYRLLRWLKPMEKSRGGDEPRFSYVPKIKRILGGDGWDGLRDKTVLDFGCGIGVGSIEMAQHGARHVIGIDIRPDVLEVARRAAEEGGVSTSCRFTQSVDEEVDVIVSMDAFEHFEDPDSIIRTMYSLLKDGGYVMCSFGPTWYHPRGGHLFSIFPWSHLIFTEESQIRWRSDFKDDGATRFQDVAGGLNMMTVGKFIDLVGRSGFEIDLLRTVPIKPLRWAHNRLTREFTTSVVECKLVKRVRQDGLNPDRGTNGVGN